MSVERPTIYVILDTNCLFEVGFNFARFRTREVIARSQAYSHVQVNWLVPTMVRLERRYQMFKDAVPLLKAAKDFHKTFGGKLLGDTEESLGQRIDEHISRQMEELGISEIELQPSQVNWTQLMFDSAMRNPPFSVSDQEGASTEKGFRDAIIQETVCQYLDGYKGNLDRVHAFVSDDKLLRQSISSKGRDVVFYVYSKIEDFETYISAIEAKISSDFGRTIAGIAERSLEEATDGSNLLLQMNVFPRIREEYNALLRSEPGPGWSVKSTGYRLGSTGFRDKQGSRFTFATQILLIQEAAKEISVIDTRYGAPSDAYSNFQGGGILGSFNDDDYGAGHAQVPIDPETGKPIRPQATGILGYVDAYRTKLVKQIGLLEFELIWQANLVSDTVLEKPSLEAIHHVGSTWAPAE